jgi:hypothetical protein
MLENIALVNLTDIIEEKIKAQPNNLEDNERQLRVVKEIGRNLIKGMNINDSCLLSRINKELYDKWIKDIPEIDKYMEIQRLTFKSKLIETLNTQATLNGDFKIALQLLMANFPQEFNPAIQKEMEKNSRPKEDDNSTLEEIFSFIQKSESVIVNKEQNNTTRTENLSIKALLSEILS